MQHEYDMIFMELYISTMKIAFICKTNRHVIIKGFPGVPSIEWVHYCHSIATSIKEITEKWVENVVGKSTKSRPKHHYILHPSLISIPLLS